MKYEHLQPLALGAALGYVSGYTSAVVPGVLGWPVLVCGCASSFFVGWTAYKT